MTPGEVGARGISLYVASAGTLRAPAEPSDAIVLAAALPGVQAHRLEIVRAFLAWDRRRLARVRLASREST